MLANEGTQEITEDKWARDREEGRSCPAANRSLGGSTVRPGGRSTGDSFWDGMVVGRTILSL